MHIIELENMGQYTTVLEEVIGGGVNRRPRDISTLDLGPTTIVLNNPRNGMPLGIGRKLNPAIGAVEAAQLIAGRGEPDLVLKIAPQFSAYLDEGRTQFHGSYGDRIGHQGHAIVQKLKRDTHTRQAAITLWDPWLDNLEAKKDYPCTIALHFAINDDNDVEMTTFMRSNDVWLGLPYDVFQFTQLQMTIAKTLNLGFGTYRHIAMSLHLYETNLKDAVRLVEDFNEDEVDRFKTYHNTYQPEGVGSPLIGFMQTMRDMQRILRNEKLSLIDVGQDWYCRQLHGEG